MANITISEQAAKNAAQQYAQDSLKLQMLQAEMAGKLQEIQDSYKKTLEKLEAKVESGKEKLQAWATENKEQFAEERTTTMGAITIGWKTNPPRIACLAKYTEAKALEKVKVLFPEYVKLKESLDKTNLKKLEAADLKKCGLQLVQEESFVLKLN